MLNTVLHGRPTARPPLLIAHGLFGSARNWGAIARRLAARRLVIVVDMRNHGASFWAETHGYQELAEDLATVIAAHGGPADVIGHSMGGKAAMALALMYPARVRRLIVADIAPVAYTHSQAPLIQAMRGLDLTEIASRAAADTALAPAVPDATTRGFLLQSLDMKEKRWRLNLDVLDAEMQTLTGWPALPHTAETPTLVLAGGASDYVRPEHRAAIKGHFPNARLAKLPGAGHWLHAERPEAFAETAEAMLSA